MATIEDLSNRGQPIHIIEEIIATKTDELATLVQTLSGTLLHDKLFALHRTLQKHQQAYQNTRHDSDEQMIKLCQNYLNTLTLAKPLLVQHRDLTYWAKGFLDILTSPIRALISVSRFLQNPAEGFQFRLFVYKPKQACATLLKSTHDLLKALEHVLKNHEEILHHTQRSHHETIDDFNRQITLQIALKVAEKMYCQTDHENHKSHKTSGP